MHTEKAVNSLSYIKDISITYAFEKLPKESDNQIELKELREFNDSFIKNLVIRKILSNCKSF